MSLSRYLLRTVALPVFLATSAFFTLLIGLPKAHAATSAEQSAASVQVPNTASSANTASSRNSAQSQNLGRLEESLGRVGSLHQKDSRTQTAVDELSAESRLLYEEYQQTLRQAEVTEAYNRQLSRLIHSQEAELGSLDQQIHSLEETDRALLPMLVAMVSKLRQFVAQDQPFQPDERQARLSRLEALLDRADVSLAEKYRQILQAYRVEVDYGRSLEAYEGDVQTPEGRRQVTYLRLGRVALYYLSADAQTGALWQPATRTLSAQWQPLNAEQKRVLKTAIQMARQQVVPELLSLPLPKQDADAAQELGQLDTTPASASMISVLTPSLALTARSLRTQPLTTRPMDGDA